jgi:hypothetical protein
MTRPWLSMTTLAATAGVALVTALAASQSGCSTVECGEGTIERDGDCVGSNQTTVPATCGDGTILVNGTCVAEAVCDPSSTVLVPVGDGTFICEGQGGGELPACDAPAQPCPQASGTTISICGQFYDVESDDPLGATEGPATRCDPTNLAPSGPCSFKLEFYDALGFSMGSTTQLAYDPDDLVYDSCGRFRVTGLTPGGSGITAVGARGAITSGIAVRATAGGTYPGQRLYTVTQATNDKWSAQIGRADIRATGVYVAIHVLPEGLTPVEGVTLTGTTGGNNANWYFSDSDPRQRSMVAPTTQGVTGANGTAILLDQPTLGSFTSTGGTLPGTCEWGTLQGGNIPGVYFIQLRVPFNGPGSTEVCSQ